MSGKEQLQRIFDYCENTMHDAWVASLSPLLNQKVECEWFVDYYDGGAGLVDEVLQREFPR